MGTVPIPSDATIDEPTASQAGTVPIPQDATIADEGPTAEQAAYQKATQAGPFAPAGAAESAITQQMGGELGVLKQGLKSAGEGAAAALGSLGAATGAEAGSEALYELAVKHLAGNVLPGMEEEAAKAKLAEMAPKVLRAARDLGLTGGGLAALLKIVFGGSSKN